MIIGRRIRVRGVVQGVGFRPTVWRLAKQYDLHGQVLNDGEGVLIDCWGTAKQLDDFISALNHQPPPLARIDSIDHEPLNSPAMTGFMIVASEHSGAHTSIVADAASCKACIADALDPQNRRYRYLIVSANSM